jgi:soluble cytochrome b562
MKLADLVVVLALLTPTAAWAHPSGHGSPSPARTEAPPPSDTVIPATYTLLVSALADGLAQAQAALDTFKIVDLHRSAAALKDLAAAAPEKSKGLTADGQTTVETSSDRLALNVDLLVSSADKGDMESARAALENIKADVQLLREQQK